MATMQRCPAVVTRWGAGPRRRSLAASLSLFVAACGGGDDGGTNASNATSATLTSGATTDAVDAGTTVPGGDASASADATSATASTGPTSATVTADGSGTSAGATSDTGPPPVEVPPYCHPACGDDAECMAAQICEDSLCVVGCRDADSCVGGNVCVDHGAGPHCAVACQGPADCDLGAGPAWDADNWACESGGCRYLGCTGDADCGAGQACRPSSGQLEVLLGISADICVPTCVTPRDCSLGIEPATADNYACVDGACDWLGCLSDTECPGAQTCE